MNELHDIQKEKFHLLKIIEAEYYTLLNSVIGKQQTFMGYVHPSQQCRPEQLNLTLPLPGMDALWKLKAILKEEGGDRVEDNMPKAYKSNKHNLSLIHKYFSEEDKSRPLRESVELFCKRVLPHSFYEYDNTTAKEKGSFTTFLGFVWTGKPGDERIVIEDCLVFSLTRFNNLPLLIEIIDGVIEILERDNPNDLGRLTIQDRVREAYQSLKYGI